MSTLQERVKERMQALGIKNIELAAACNVRPPTSFNWASGKTKNIKGEPLLLAAKTLGVRPQWLATGVGPMLPDEARYLTQNESNNALFVSESNIARLPGRAIDPLTQELVELFSKLEAPDKREWLANLKGFVAGRRPHPNGPTPAMAGK